MQIPNESVAKKTVVVSPWKVSHAVPAFEGFQLRVSRNGSKYSSGNPSWKVWFGLLRFRTPKLPGDGFKDVLMFPLICGNDSHFDEHMFQRGWFNHQTRLSTICKTKIVPENGWLGDYTFVESACFQGLCLLVSGNVRKSFFVG